MTVPMIDIRHHMMFVISAVAFAVLAAFEWLLC
jgi:hypothetical protein